MSTDPLGEDINLDQGIEVTSENYESFLISTIIPQLKAGRPNWDAPHTLAVVHHIKQIIDSLPNASEIDRVVLIIAAYCHDWGYTRLFANGQVVASYDDIKKQKELHMKIGAEKTAKLLEKFTFLTAKQKERIIHLVSVHDKVEELIDLDEILLMEADTLGAVDSSLVTPTFDKPSYIRYIAATRQNRISRFRSEYSKSNVERMIATRMEYYENHSGEN